MKHDDALARIDGMSNILVHFQRISVIQVALVLIYDRTIEQQEERHLFCYISIPDSFISARLVQINIVRHGRRALQADFEMRFSFEFHSKTSNSLQPQQNSVDKVLNIVLFKAAAFLQK